MFHPRHGAPCRAGTCWSQANHLLRSQPGPGPQVISNRHGDSTRVGRVQLQCSAFCWFFSSSVNTRCAPIVARYMCVLAQQLSYSSTATLTRADDLAGPAPACQKGRQGTTTSRMLRRRAPPDSSVRAHTGYTVGGTPIWRRLTRDLFLWLTIFAAAHQPAAFVAVASWPTHADSGINFWEGQSRHRPRSPTLTSFWLWVIWMLNPLWLGQEAPSEANNLPQHCPGFFTGSFGISSCLNSDFGNPADFFLPQL